MSYAYDHYNHNLRYADELVDFLDQFPLNVTMHLITNYDSMNFDNLERLIEIFLHEFKKKLLGRDYWKEENKVFYPCGVFFSEKLQSHPHAHLVMWIHDRFVENPADLKTTMDKADNAWKKVTKGRGSFQFGSKPEEEYKEKEYENYLARITPAAHGRLIYDRKGALSYGAKTKYHNNQKTLFGFFGDVKALMQ